MKRIWSIALLASVIIGASHTSAQADQWKKGDRKSSRTRQADRRTRSRRTETSDLDQLIAECMADMRSGDSKSCLDNKHLCCMIKLLKEIRDKLEVIMVNDEGFANTSVE